VKEEKVTGKMIFPGKPEGIWPAGMISLIMGTAGDQSPPPVTSVILCAQSLKMLRIIRYFMASVLLIIALNAFGGGAYGIAGARDLPLGWLSGVPSQAI